ncbi:MAG TPA: helix-turn-helix domain-containing protein [Gemmatimonadaceae bacterium]|nr:helix-turn-helix domain-containing protein [Gemmatimonadaceae bacterium]
MKPLRIGFLGFDGIQALDLVGPADAFTSDAFLAAEPGTGNGAPQRPYEIVIIGLHGRRFTAESGLEMRADVVVPAAVRLDTLIIPGGRGLRRPGIAERAAEWIGARAPHIRRIASVCTGIYGLAPTGLLDGRRVTTHWAATQDVERRFPKLRMDSNALFVRDGKYSTAAGITAGIDLALALIEEDCGSPLALAVAREMVVFFKRPGGQAQFSEPLQFQLASTDRFAELQAWLPAHLRADLSVEALAARTFLSPRQFARTFKREYRTTPATFVEAMRLGEACRRLSSRGVSVGSVARSVGYASEDAFRRAFERRFGVTPSSYRSRFGHKKARAS